MRRSIFRFIPFAAASLALSSIALAQSASTGGFGWEGGIDLIYQGGKTLNFDGGTTANLDSDFGFSLYLGYRATPHLEGVVAFDWTNVDYKANLATGLGSFVTANGSYQAFTPRLNLQYNILDQPLTPFLMAGIGYSFIDTNIPAGRPQSGCWFDPWYGYVCGTVQSTHSTDGFAFQIGAGGRWDLTGNVSLRLGWERHWVDLSHGGGTPFLDLAKIGVTYRY